MTITVKLFATLRAGRFVIEDREYPDGASVGNIVKDLDIPEEEVALMLVNGLHVEIDRVLSDGDTLALFPPVGGG